MTYLGNRGVLCLLLLLACDDSDKVRDAQARRMAFAGLDTSISKDQLITRQRAVAEGIAHALSTGGTARACGTRQSTKPRRFLILTAEHCWGCRDIGRVLRRASTADADGLWIATTVRDSAEVCKYAIQERIAGRIPMFAFPNTLLADTGVRPFLVLADLDSDGHVTQSRTAVHLAQLIAMDSVKH